MLTRVSMSSSMMMIFCAILATFREPEGKETALALGAIEFHPSPMIFRDHFDDGEADATTAILCRVVETEVLACSSSLIPCPVSWISSRHSLSRWSSAYGQCAADWHSIKGINGGLRSACFSFPSSPYPQSGSPGTSLRRMIPFRAASYSRRLIRS